MGYQIWTRKANAIEAVKKFIQTNVPNELVIDEVFAREAEGGFSVTIVADVDAEGLERLTEILGQKAHVIPTKEPFEEEPEAIEASDAPPVAAKPRSSGKRLYCVDAAKNPFRPGSRSHAAWEHVAANPGLTYGEVKAHVGHRVRAIVHCVSMGWIETRS